MWVQGKGRETKGKEGNRRDRKGTERKGKEGKGRERKGIGRERKELGCADG